MYIQQSLIESVKIKICRKIQQDFGWMGITTVNLSIIGSDN